MSRAGDLFRTQFSLTREDKTVPLLRSVDADRPTVNQAWPPSPPLQEVVLQSNDRGDFLAGVGRAGKSHWSVIITPLTGEAGFEWDFACRVKTHPEWLGSTYQIVNQN